MDFISFSPKSVEKWGSCWRLKNSIWPTMCRHFEYLIPFQNFYNCFILSSLYHHIIQVPEDMQLCTLGKWFI